MLTFITLCTEHDDDDGDDAIDDERNLRHTEHWGGGGGLVHCYNHVCNFWWNFFSL